MALKTKHIEGIHGLVKYEVQALPARKATNALKILAPLLTLLQGDFSQLPSVAKDFELSYLEDLFMPVTLVDGAQLTPQKFDSHYSENLFEWAEWLGFCLEINYKSFLDGMIKKVAGIQQQAATKVVAKAD